MKGTSMTAVAREELKAAHAALAAAERKLETARAATSKARALSAEITRQAAAQEAVERRASVSLADRIKAAIKGGADPSFDEDTAKNASTRTALEGRRQTAEQVVADLTEEEREAAEAVEASREAVSHCIKAVMREEARALAERWNVAEAEARVAEAKARSMRLRLGRFHDVVDKLGRIDDQVWEALRLNTLDDYDLEADRAVRGVWTSFATALTRDADAKPDFARAEAHS
jgi:hypothetical protein